MNQLIYCCIISISFIRQIIASPVIDTEPPTITCINGFTANLPPTQSIQFSVYDFLASVEDNVTPQPQIRLGIRKSGVGSGFPFDANGDPVQTLSYGCDELGIQFVELWAIDQAGNAAYCETIVSIDDNLDYCSGVPPKKGGQIKDELLCGLEGFKVNLLYQNPAIPMLGYPWIIAGNGAYTLDEQTPFSDSLYVVPEHDLDPLNGVSTFDLVLMSRHILAFQPLVSPYKIIAADVSRNGSVTTFDIIELRKLILGIYQKLPNNKSWRFVDRSFIFPVLFNPFHTAFPEKIPTSKFLAPGYSGDFVAIKVGDVNNSAQCNQFGGISDDALAYLHSENYHFQEGEVFEVPFSCSEAILGCQFTLEFPGLELLEAIPGESLSPDNFGLFNQALSFSTEKAGNFDFILRFRALETGETRSKLLLSDRKAINESYLNLAGDRRRMKLAYNKRSGLQFLETRPNPFTDRVQVSFYLPEAMDVQFSLFDASGKSILEKNAYYTEGNQEIQVNLGSDIKPGIYTLKLLTGKAMVSQRLVRM